AGAKTTTKLGDVYADLFAQFGLSEAKADEPETKDTTAEAKAAASTADAVLAAGDAAGAEGAATVAGSVNEADVADVVADATAATEPAPKQQPVKAEAEEPVDPENAIDAAEAAALLTAAFRQGKRPAAQAAEDEDAYADVVVEDTTDDSAEAEAAHEDEDETHA